MSVIKVVRKARKKHHCDSCRSPIEPGSTYLTHTALAGDDYYEDALDSCTLQPAKQPIRSKECGECATRYGRGELIEARELKLTSHTIAKDMENGL